MVLASAVRMVRSGVRLYFRLALGR